MEHSSQSTSTTSEDDCLNLTDGNSNTDIDKEDSAENDNTCNSENEKSTQSSSETDNQSNTDNESEIPAHKQRLSTAWEKIKPQYKDRLYYKILHSADIPNTLHFWLIDYEYDKKRVTFELLQFFIDLAGYQFININKFSQEHVVINVFNHLENIENPVYRETGKYLLAYRTKSYFLKRKKIEDFMVNLVKKFVLENDYFHSSINRNCINFLKLLCKSKRRSIRHTALKYQSGLAEVLSDLEATNFKSNDFSRLSAKVKKLSTIIQQFVFPECCKLLDKCLVGLREDCVLELTNWMFIHPSVFLSERLLSYLLAFAVDYKKEVRLTTLKKLSKLLEVFADKLENSISKIVDTIGERIFDVNFNVATLAVDILSFLYKCNNKWISHNICNNIISRVYCFDYRFAAACGRFLVVMLQKQTTDEVTILQKLILFEMRSNYKGINGRHALLVEAVVDAFPALLDLSLHRAVLDEIEKDGNQFSVFINILTEVIYQTMTGRCTLRRKNARKGAVDELDIFLVKRTLCELLPLLLKKDNAKVLNPLFVAYHKYFRK